MSNSSQPKISSIDLPTIKSIDDILKDCMISTSATGSDTITITTDGDMSYSYSDTYNSINTISLPSISIDGQPTYSLGSGSPTTITLNGVDTSHFTYDFHKEWQNCFPQWTRVQDMCKEYPGLKIAFENFKVFYEMVKDDYDNPTPKK